VASRTTLLWTPLLHELVHPTTARDYSVPRSLDREPSLLRLVRELLGGPRLRPRGHHMGRVSGHSVRMTSSPGAASCTTTFSSITRRSRVARRSAIRPKPAVLPDHRPRSIGKSSSTTIVTVWGQARGLSDGGLSRLTARSRTRRDRKNMVRVGTFARQRAFWQGNALIRVRRGSRAW